LDVDIERGVEAVYNVNVIYVYKCRNSSEIGSIQLNLEEI